MLLLVSNVPSFLRSEAAALNWRWAKSLKCISPFQSSSASHCKITMSSTAVRAGNGKRQKEKIHISESAKQTTQVKNVFPCWTKYQENFMLLFQKENTHIKGHLALPHISKWLTSWVMCVLFWRVNQSALCSPIWKQSPKLALEKQHPLSQTGLWNEQ